MHTDRPKWRHETLLFSEFGGIKCIFLNPLPRVTVSHVQRVCLLHTEKQWLCLNTWATSKQQSITYHGAYHQCSEKSTLLTTVTYANLLTDVYIVCMCTLTCTRACTHNSLLHTSGTVKSHNGSKTENSVSPDAHLNTGHKVFPFFLPNRNQQSTSFDFSFNSLSVQL